MAEDMKVVTRGNRRELVKYTKLQRPKSLTALP